MLIFINKILWGIATIIILMVGIYFTYKLNFIQFRFMEMIKYVFSENKIEKDKISPLEALNMSLAARIGVGSLAGIALSIYWGGIGTIFWIWASAFIASPNTFAECLLGAVYKQKDEKNIYRGGPPYYILNGLGKIALAKISAFFILFAYIFAFLPIQANTITKSIISILDIYPLIIASLIIILTAVVIFKGVKQIAIISSKLVPIMGGIYILGSMTIIILNINQIPHILVNIIKEAFNMQAFGVGVLTTMIIGLQRGIFSNEAGLGTSAIVAATTTDSKPVEIGLIQMLGVYYTTLIICTMTALVILTSNYQTLSLSDINGIELTLYAFKYHIGFLGEILVIITIILFAFSTIITGYYYGESCLKFLVAKTTSYSIFILRILTIILLFIGSVMSPSYLWRFIDILVAIIAIINLYALILLRKDVFYEYDYYKREGKYDKI